MIIKLYNYVYIYYLKIIYSKRFKLIGNIKSKGLLNIELSKGSLLTISGNLILQKNVLIAVRKNAILNIGDNCFFNRNCSIICRDNINIENHCLFGENVKIYDNNHKIINNQVSKDLYDTKKLIIENNSWVANDCNILMGSNIKENSVIGAMSLVNKDLKDSGIYVGIPVKLIKKF
jgi:maltose O-acetyltransferase